MDQNYTNNQNDFLWTLLANPASDAHQYTYNLQRLVNDFPQSGILQAMLAHASDDKNLRQASAYFNPKSLYKLINSPSSFIGVADEKIIYQGNLITNGHSYLNGSAPVFEDATPTQPHDAAATNNENYFSENPVVETATGNQLHISDHSVEIEPANTLHLTEAVSEELPPVTPLPEVSEVATPAENSLHQPYVSLNESIASRLKETPEAADDESPRHIPYVSINESLASRLKETADSTPVQDVVQETPVDTPPPIAEHVYEPVVAANPVADTGIYEPVVTPDQVTDTSAQEPVAITAPVAENAVEEQVSATIINQPPVIEQVEEVKPAEAAAAEVIEADPFAVRDVWRPAKFIEEETFDEITGIEQINVAPQPPAPEPEPIKIHEEKPAPEPVIKNDADHTFVDNIAATDYFRFRDKFGEQKQAEQTESQPAPTPPPVEKVAEKIVSDDDTESQRVSKYHDEKMPYSFMWWLDKTRKEHAGIYQPYVKTETRSAVAKPKNPGDELQQQYYENIFHITSVEELDKTTGARPAPFVVKRKEQGIIERFIKEEPQIRPQSSDKLDNENKAKKSSEDRDEMVTETLAAIYTDQMLYHKAIASYRKLMLKFPEKSRYFASKIEQLEKKTN